MSPEILERALLSSPSWRASLTQNGLTTSTKVVKAIFCTVEVKRLTCWLAQRLQGTYFGRKLLLNCVEPLIPVLQ